MLSQGVMQDLPKMWVQGRTMGFLHRGVSADWLLGVGFGFWG